MTSTETGIDKAVVTLASKMLLGTERCTANIAGLRLCNAAVYQRVVNASLGRPRVLSNGSHAVVLNWIASTSPR